eukprot:8366287-Pyramimonas_sp.AAC.1
MSGVPGACGCVNAGCTGRVSGVPGARGCVDAGCTGRVSGLPGARGCVDAGCACRSLRGDVSLRVCSLVVPLTQFWSKPAVFKVSLNAAPEAGLYFTPSLKQLTEEMGAVLWDVPAIVHGLPTPHHASKMTNLSLIMRGDLELPLKGLSEHAMLIQVVIDPLRAPNARRGGGGGEDAGRLSSYGGRQRGGVRQAGGPLRAPPVGAERGPAGGGGAGGTYATVPVHPGPLGGGLH